MTQWKPRLEWPEIMDMDDILNCVPGADPDMAEDVLNKLGENLNGRLVVSRSLLTSYLDGDAVWTVELERIRLETIIERLMLVPERLLFPKSESEWEELRQAVAG
jgi:hypothetical protein